MLIELDVQAANEEIRFTLPQFNANIVLKNSVAYRIDKHGNKLIVAVGEEADALSKRVTADLTGDLVGVNIVHPFDIGQFAPDFIEAMIRYGMAFLIAGKRRAYWFRSLYVDRLILRLSIAEYERRSQEQRQEFEYKLQKTLTPKVRELIVNGGSSLLPEFVQAKRRFERQCSVAEWCLWGLRLLGMLGPFLFLLRVWPDFSGISELMRASMMLMVGLVGAVLGDWLALTLWGIVVPKFIPLSVLRTVITETNLAKIEKTWLDRFLREPESDSASTLL